MQFQYPSVKINTINELRGKIINKHIPLLSFEEKQYLFFSSDRPVTKNLILNTTC